jgi:hypothetical protein
MRDQAGTWSATTQWQVLARMRPAGRADQCPQLGVERTQRGPLLWAVHDPLRTSTAVANRRPVVRWLAYPLTDPREFDILHAVVVSGQRMPFDRLKRRDFIRLLGGLKECHADSQK